MQQVWQRRVESYIKGCAIQSKSNSNLFTIGKAIKEGWKLTCNEEDLVLMKGSIKLVFDIKVVTKHGVIFCSYLQR